jgi:hypothetical protein
MNAFTNSHTSTSSLASSSDLFAARQFGCFLLEHCRLQLGDPVAIQLPKINQYLIAVRGDR